MSAGHIMQMQRAVGNKGVMQMLGGAVSGRPGNMRPPVTPAASSIAPAGPSAVGPSAAGPSAAGLASDFSMR
jgi:hypothetical protein